MDNDISRAAFVKGQLSARERDLLTSYKPGGATIWDATSLHATVFRLLDLGLIYHHHEDANSWAYRLTPLGVAVQSDE